jgi:hypothetical protein
MSSVTGDIPWTPVEVQSSNSDALTKAAFGIKCGHLAEPPHSLSGSTNWTSVPSPLLQEAK